MTEFKVDRPQVSIIDIMGETPGNLFHLNEPTLRWLGCRND